MKTSNKAQEEEVEAEKGWREVEDIRDTRTGFECIFLSNDQREGEGERIKDEVTASIGSAGRTVEEKKSQEMALHRRDE